MLRRFTCALVVALSTVAAVGLAAPANASNAGSFLVRINADRARAGRSPLASRADLADIALQHSQAMAAQNSLKHNPRLTAQVANWQAVGENVGMGGSAQVLHVAFMNSPAHRANILDKDFTEIGLGVTVDARGVMWVTEVFRRPMGVVVQARTRVLAASRTAGTTTRAVTGRSPAPRHATNRPGAKRIPAVRWAAPPTRAAKHPSGRSAWLTRLDRAAGAHPAQAIGALPQALEYLHVVTA